VKRCDVYLGIFGYEYGYEGSDGISPTEHEYDYAGKQKKTRLVYIWGDDEKPRVDKMRALIHKAESDLIRRRVKDMSTLTAEVYASFIDYLDTKGALRVPPFDVAPCENATLDDLSRKRIEWFLETARRERAFPLKPNTSTEAVLIHLNILEQDKPTHAAVLLFGSNPQRFLRTAEIKCIHCHGTEYRRPFGSLQVYGGDLFGQADQAIDFVLGKINRAIGTRSEGVTAPATYELPPEAIGEAIINAIAHRDYYSNASVEVRLFADRLEVWNPGKLPETLTLDSLRRDHPSVPHNPLVAEALYLTRYIERVGSGTQTMIELCREVGLPEPQFEQRAGSFIVTLWRDWLTSEVLSRYVLSDRQRNAIIFLKKHGKITNSQYQVEFSVAKRTASLDLAGLLAVGLIEKTGSTGKGVYYLLAKGASKGQKGQ
jgi:ATP-dependent DNA helicase RecG